MISIPGRSILMLVVFLTEISSHLLLSCSFQVNTRRLLTRLQCQHGSLQTSFALISIHDSLLYHLHLLVVSVFLDVLPSPWLYTWDWLQLPSPNSSTIVRFLWRPILLQGRLRDVDPGSLLYPSYTEQCLVKRPWPNWSVSPTPNWSVRWLIPLLWRALFRDF